MDKGTHTIAKQSAAVLALGLGLAAGAPAEATVQYFAVDPSSLTVQDGSFSFLDAGSGNHFQIYHFHSGIYGYANISSYSGASNIAVTPYTSNAAFLKFGEGIGTKGSPLQFSGYAYLGGNYWASQNGNWPGAGKGYLGLQFTESDGSHYGWAKLEMPADNEDQAETPILAGAGDPNPVPLPGSVALLASGAAGLLAYRRMRRAA